MNDEIDYQEAIKLTSEQEKAFNALIRAVKRCNKEKVYFYQVLDTLGALNGHNVASIDNGRSDDINSLCFLDYPYVQLTRSWADDSHNIILKD